MSDYLGNLAARTLAAPPLRPRVRMRFEPQAAEAAQPPQIEARREDGAAETPRGEQPPRVIERERVREVVKPGRETTRVVVMEAKLADTPPPTAPREREVIERVETIKSPAVEVAVEVERSGRLVHSVAQSGRDVRSPQAAAKKKNNNEAPRPHRYDEEPPRVVAQEAPIRERRVPSEREAPEAAEPSVQVSIGRIEIRATTAPAAQRRPRARTAMSIDDYIAKRDAKERR
jgi:hypothetical protein